MRDREKTETDWERNTKKKKKTEKEGHRKRKKTKRSYLSSNIRKDSKQKISWKKERKLERTRQGETIWEWGQGGEGGRQ